MKFNEFFMKQEIQQVATLLAKILSVPQRRHFVKEEKAHEVTERYWTDPNSPLMPFLAKHGIEHPGRVPEFAQGGVGRVYFVGDYAVKFSANRVEANVAQMVKGKEDLPTAVIDVQHLDNGIYVILQPTVEMYNVPAELKKAADYVTAIVDDHPEMSGFPANLAQQEQLCHEALIKHGGNLSLLPHMLSIIGVLSKLYHATGYKHDDAGPSNIGMYKNKVVIPDLGPNEPKGFNQLSALSKINQNRTALGLPRHQSF